MLKLRRETHAEYKQHTAFIESVVGEAHAAPSDAGLSIVGAENLESTARPDFA